MNSLISIINITHNIFSTIDTLDIRPDPHDLSRTEGVGVPSLLAGSQSLI